MRIHDFILAFISNPNSSSGWTDGELAIQLNSELHKQDKEARPRNAEMWRWPEYGVPPLQYVPMYRYYSFPFGAVLIPYETYGQA